MDSRYDVFLWLLYWMCYGMLSIVDFYAETIMDVLPVYWLFKVSLLAALLPIKDNGKPRQHLSLPQPYKSFSYFFNSFNSSF